MALQPMNYIKRSTQVTFTPRIYQIAVLLSWPEDKAAPKTTNMQSPAPSSVFWHCCPLVCQKTTSL